MANHWYRHDGSPMFEIQALNGEMRKTTLRDARQLNLVPSVTTILSIIEKPGLIKWQVDQGIMAALTLKRQENEPDAEFLVRLYKDSREQVIKAGVLGDQIHDACDKYFSGRPYEDEFTPYVQAVKDIIV